MFTRIDKALIAGILAAVAVLSTAQSNGVALDEAVWVQALVALLIAAAGVWLIPNKPPA